MSAAFNGDFSSSEPNEVRYSYVPFRGWQTVWIYKNTQANISSIAAVMEATGGCSLDMSHEGPIWTLNVTFDYKNDGVSAEVPINTWELIGNDVQKDIYEHPKVLAFGDDAVSFITNWVKKIKDQGPDATDSNGTGNTLLESALFQIPNHVTDIQRADSLKFFKHLLKDDHPYFSVSEFVLRHTQSVSNTYTTQFALNDIDQIFSTEQVKAEAVIPASIVFDIGTIAAPTAQDGFQWGWLKRSPQIVFAAGAKLQVTQEYWLDQWSTFNYDVKA